MVPPGLSLAFGKLRLANRPLFRRGASPSLDAALNTGALVSGAETIRRDPNAVDLRLSVSRDAKRFTFSLDHWVSTGDGIFRPWQPRQRAILALRERVTVGDLILPLLRREDGRWFWCEDADSGAPSPPARSRGRFVLAADGFPEQRLYFILIWSDGENGPDPVLIDETAFAFKDGWEAEAPLAERPRWRGR